MGQDAREHARTATALAGKLPPEMQLEIRGRRIQAELEAAALAIRRRAGE